MKVPQCVEAPLSSQSVTALGDQINQLDLCHKLAAKLCVTKLVPKTYQNEPYAGAVAIFWGAHLGLNAMESLQNIAVINGTPTLWGDALVAIVKASPHCEYLTTIFDEENKKAIVKTKRKGEPEETRTFSLDDAKRAGLAERETYKKHPKRMLQARARSHLLRDVYADLIKGFQIREITEEDYANYGAGEKDITPPPETDSKTLRALTAEIKHENLHVALSEATTEEELQKIRADITALAESQDKMNLKTLWVARRQELQDG